MPNQKSPSMLTGKQLYIFLSIDVYFLVFMYLIILYFHRYTVIRQRMARIKTTADGTLNQPLTIGDKIRDVDYLLSSGACKKFDLSSKSDSILLLGVLVQLKEGGRHYLEDPTGAIPLDISATISF